VVVASPASALVGRVVEAVDESSSDPHAASSATTPNADAHRRDDHPPAAIRPPIPLPCVPGRQAMHRVHPPGAVEQACCSELRFGDALDRAGLL
jgi:hypothetical protein